MADNPAMNAGQDQGIIHAVSKEQARLRRFIRRHVVDRGEAEDILQDVFYELVDAYRLMQPIEQVGAWMMRVARNRIIDRFRRKKHEALPESSFVDADGETLNWDELLPASDAGPDALFARRVMMEQIESAIADLPALQRETFIAHEFDGRSFKELSVELGVSVNTLLSRKHAAVTALRARLQDIYQEFGGTSV
ncbi:MAG: RNA polymerase sigma factor [Steroidobacteraceae bacterium]